MSTLVDPLPVPGGHLPLDVRPRRVVVGYDGSPESRAALREAVARAGWAEAPLVVVTAAEPVAFAYELYPEIEALARGHAADAMASAVEHLPLGDVSQHVAAGTPSSVLLQLARPDDLLVVGTRGQGRVERWLLGSTSTGVATHAPCPVLVVPRDARHDGAVVAGVDGSAASWSVLAHARAEAARQGTSLQVVSAVPPLPTRVEPDGLAVAAERQRVADVRRLLARLVEQAGVESLASVDVQVEADPAAEVLRRKAGAARLLVVGSKGHGGLHALLLGSVSRAVLHQTPCAVLVVRSPAWSETPAGTPAA
ncbi:universal stress protein [Aquipuribacter nitratireducens]|uniref:Universal stress protein n=1 Tax=Aquipuribacter nitratireducens TaxID=650104 RepID=A0ABW0GPK2_9MICO